MSTSSPPTTTVKYLWIRLALYEKKLSRIIDHLVTNATRYYDRDSLVADPDYGSILSSLLVGPCALDYSRTKTVDHFWSDPPADEFPRNLPPIIQIPSGDDKSDAGKGSHKSSDEKSDDQNINQLKRVCSDKESVSSRCTSPSDSAKSVDEKKMSNEEQRQQRVLRSSHRGGQSVDRGSNNSSPQLQSSSPSPAPASTDPPTESTPKPTTTTNNNPCSANPPTIPDNDNNANVPSPSASSTSSTKHHNTVDLHPRKRKIRASKEENKQSVSAPSSSTSSTDNNDNVPSNEIHPHDQPITNCYQMYLNNRQQIERRHRNLFPVQPKAPQGFQDYLMNRRTYVLTFNVLLFFSNNSVQKDHPSNDKGPQNSLNAAIKDRQISKQTHESMSQIFKLISDKETSKEGLKEMKIILFTCSKTFPKYVWKR